MTAVTQQFKPEIYPRVDDEATILLEYPEAQGIIQASWNWPFDRKDLEVYGDHGSGDRDDGGLRAASRPAQAIPSTRSRPIRVRPTSATRSRT